jgi:hypothetical protein
MRLIMNGEFWPGGGDTVIAVPRHWHGFCLKDKEDHENKRRAFCQSEIWIACISNKNTRVKVNWTCLAFVSEVKQSVCFGSMPWTGAGGVVKVKFAFTLDDTITLRPSLHLGKGSRFTIARSFSGYGFKEGICQHQYQVSITRACLANTKKRDQNRFREAHNRLYLD